MTDTTTSLPAPRRDDLPEIDRSAVFLEGQLNLAPALDALDHEPTADDLLPIGHSISATARNANWWYGDFLLEVEKRFGREVASQFMDSRGQSTGYFTSVIETARIFPPKDRLIPHEGPDGFSPGLSWTSHREARIVSDRKTRLALLKQAMEEQMSTREITQEARRLEANALAIEAEEVSPGEDRPAATASFTITVTVPREYASAANEAMDDLKKGVRLLLTERRIKVKQVSTVERNPVDEQKPPAAPAKKAAAKKAPAKKAAAKKAPAAAK